MAEVIEKRRAVERFAWGSEASEDVTNAETASVSSCCGGGVSQEAVAEEAVAEADEAEEVINPGPEPVQAASGGCCGGG